MGRILNKKSKASHIGRYQLQDKLGEGGFGIVHRAYDPVMDRSVAIKSVKVDSMTEEQIEHARSEFRHEATIALSTMSDTS